MLNSKTLCFTLKKEESLCIKQGRYIYKYKMHTYHNFPLLLSTLSTLHLTNRLLF